MIACEHCQKSILPALSVCPSCGRPQGGTSEGVVKASRGEAPSTNPGTLGARAPRARNLRRSGQTARTRDRSLFLGWIGAYLAIFAVVIVSSLGEVGSWACSGLLLVAVALIISSLWNSGGARDTDDAEERESPANEIPPNDHYKAADGTIQR